MRTLRIAVLAYVLVMVAVLAWLAKARSTDWDDTLYMAVYPVDGDGSARTRAYLAALRKETFAPVAEFVAREAARHGVALAEPLAIELGAQAPAPPAPPDGGNALAAIVWSLRMRFHAARVEHAQDLPAPDVRMFVVYHDPATHARLAHSLGLEKGLVGVVNAYAADDYAGSNAVVIAHELMHTLGATDKYDRATSLPRHPDGYAEPEREPLYPQRRAEIMGGRVPLSPTTAEMPDGLGQCVVGALTAAEIRWRR
jgi:hypothetical protein